MVRRIARRGGVEGAGSLLRACRFALLALAAITALAAFTAPTRVRVPAGAALTSGTDFVVSGDAVQVTPGLPTSLGVSVTNPLSEPIALTSVTVTVSPTPTIPLVPPNCPGTDLSLQYQSQNVPFTGSPSQAVLTFPSPQPVVASGASTSVAALDLLLVRSAGNECQQVVFPLNYAATATSIVATTPSTAPPSVTPTSVTPPSATPTTTAFTSTEAGSALPFTGAQIAELAVSGTALVVIGVLTVVLARRRRSTAK